MGSPPSGDSYISHGPFHGALLRPRATIQPLAPELLVRLPMASRVKDAPPHPFIRTPAAAPRQQAYKMAPPSQNRSSSSSGGREYSSQSAPDSRALAGRQLSSAGSRFISSGHEVREQSRRPGKQGWGDASPAGLIQQALGFDGTASDFANRNNNDMRALGAIKKQMSQSWNFGGGSSSSSTKSSSKSLCESLGGGGRACPPSLAARRRHVARMQPQRSSPPPMNFSQTLPGLHKVRSSTGGHIQGFMDSHGQDLAAELHSFQSLVRRRGHSDLNHRKVLGGTQELDAEPPHARPTRPIRSKSAKSPLSRRATNGAVDMHAGSSSARRSSHHKSAPSLQLRSERAGAGDDHNARNAPKRSAAQKLKVGSGRKHEKKQARHQEQHQQHQQHQQQQQQQQQLPPHQPLPPPQQPLHETDFGRSFQRKSRRREQVVKEEGESKHPDSPTVEGAATSAAAMAERDSGSTRGGQWIIHTPGKDGDSNGSVNFQPSGGGPVSNSSLPQPRRSGGPVLQEQHQPEWKEPAVDDVAQKPEPDHDPPPRQPPKLQRKDSARPFPSASVSLPQRLGLVNPALATQQRESRLHLEELEESLRAVLDSRSEPKGDDEEEGDEEEDESAIIVTRPALAKSQLSVQQQMHILNNNGLSRSDSDEDDEDEELLPRSWLGVPESTAPLKVQRVPPSDRPSLAREKDGGGLPAIAVTRGQQWDLSGNGADLAGLQGVLDDLQDEDDDGGFGWDIHDDGPAAWLLAARELALRRLDQEVERQRVVEGGQAMVQRPAERVRERAQDAAAVRKVTGRNWSDLQDLDEASRSFELEVIRLGAIEKAEAAEELALEQAAEEEYHRLQGEVGQ